MESGHFTSLLSVSESTKCGKNSVTTILERSTTHQFAFCSAYRSPSAKLSPFS